MGLSNEKKDLVYFELNRFLREEGRSMGVLHIQLEVWLVGGREMGLWNCLGVKP